MFRDSIGSSWRVGYGALWLLVCMMIDIFVGLRQSMLSLRADVLWCSRRGI